MSEHAQLLAALVRVGDTQEKVLSAINSLVETLTGANATSEANRAIRTAQSAALYAEQKAIHAEPNDSHAQAEVAQNTANGPSVPTSLPIETVVQQPAPVQISSFAAQGAADVTPDYETTSRKIIELNSKKGREVAVGLLAKFGAKSLRDIPAENFGKVIAACDEALA